MDAIRFGRNICAASIVKLTSAPRAAASKTARAAVRLLRKAGAQVTQAAFVIDLPDLGGADALRAEGIHVTALTSFKGH